jgi:hypothetical protein
VRGKSRVCRGRLMMDMQPTQDHLARVAITTGTRLVSVRMKPSSSVFLLPYLAEDRPVVMHNNNEGEVHHTVYIRHAIHVNHLTQITQRN